MGAYGCVHVVEVSVPLVGITSIGMWISPKSGVFSAIQQEFTQLFFSKGITTSPSGCSDAAVSLARLGDLKADCRGHSHPLHTRH